MATHNLSKSTLCRHLATPPNTLIEALTQCISRRSGERTRTSTHTQQEVVHASAVMARALAGTSDALLHTQQLHSKKGSWALNHLGFC